MVDISELNRVCVATSDASAYYALVSRLRQAGLPFTSVFPGLAADYDLVLTTRDEAGRFGGKTLVLEELDEDPAVFKGQVVARLEGGSDVLLVGVDPGKRTGLAAFYGRTKLGSSTHDSASEVCRWIAVLAGRIPSRQVLVRIGSGNKKMAVELAESVQGNVHRATVEIVNESGTSAGSPKMRGVQRDQVAAAKIAFRKGRVFTPGAPRIAG